MEVAASDRRGFHNGASPPDECGCSGQLAVRDKGRHETFKRLRARHQFFHNHSIARATLLDAARELIREKGYERTTLEEVASRAGMTTGAIYGDFKNRDELFIALGHAYWAPVVPQVGPGATFTEAMRALASATLAAADERAPAAIGRLTGLAYTLRSDEMRARVRQVTKDSYELGAEWLGAFDPRELPMPPEHLVVVVHALIEGLVMQRILTPELCPDEVVYEAFAALARRP